MYIPISYWQTQGGIPHMRAMQFAIAGAPTIAYKYNNQTYNTQISAIGNRVVTPVCQDIYNNTELEYDTLAQAGASFFCSAEPTSSVTITDCINYTFEYGGIGCSIGGAATAEYYDCNGNRQLETVYWGDAPITRCVTSVVDRSCVREVSLGTVCGSKTTSTPSTCCISAPPKTGAEAWYIEIFYPNNAQSDYGTCYFNYIDKNGDIINDTLTRAEVKKTIISQANPLVAQWVDDPLYPFWMPWRLIEKFPGQVLKYPYYNIPATYTFQLKRDVRISGEFARPYQTYYSGSTNATNYVGQLIQPQLSSLNATWNIVANTPPIDNSVGGNGAVPMVWITNVVPVAKTALQLVSCQTTHSLWTTLDNYDAYNTGSILKVTNAELTTTSSCWTINNLTSSLSVSVALTNVNVTQSYSAGFCVNCLGFSDIVMATGGTSGSFLSGSTLYKYNAFTSNDTFNIVSGSITDGKLMVIAGGGGGGSRAGGGAGGLVYSSSVSLVSNTPYNIIVGTGGAAYNGTLYNQNAANGNNSTFSGSGFNIIAIGGGKGASYTGESSTTNGGDGGSGGGGNINGSAGSGTSGQGNGGGNAGQIGITFWEGGGGGAGSGGQTRFGGSGIELGSIMVNVSSTYCVGGGPAGLGLTSTSGSGGFGGGGSTSGQTGRNGLVVITYPAFN
jgi:hypothetical protein